MIINSYRILSIRSRLDCLSQANPSVMVKHAYSHSYNDKSCGPESRQLPVIAKAADLSAWTDGK